MKQILIMTVALLCTVALGAWAETSTAFGGGDGSAKTPYIISTTEHWEQLATDVAAGTTFSGQYFQLDADITVSAMLGTGTASKDAKPFSGTFDGNGHTLTFNHTATEAEGDIAPFRFIKNATIQNLHIDGTINTAYRHAAGLAARTYGTTLIKNCRVSTVIKSSVSGDGTHGGIVVMKPNWDSANLTIEGCVFDGKILSTGTSATTLCGGLVGYTSYGSLTIKNCIYAPAAPAAGETAVSGERTLYRYDSSHPGTITVSNCYYTETMGTVQGKLMHSITVPTGVYIVPTGEATIYSASGITAYEGNPCLEYNDVLRAGSDDAPTLTFTHDFPGSTASYSVQSPATLTDNGNDVYTLTMPDANVEILVNMQAPGVYGLTGSGTAGSPYLIGISEEWDKVVSYINKGESGYDIAYYKLTDDIAVTTMMGNSTNKFKGHFDGNNKTLTVNYDTNEEYTAPFRYTEGADIYDLVVAGTIKTSRKYAAGLIANAAGGTNGTKINRCRIDATLSSTLGGDGTHGGFVAHNTGGTINMMGCVFNGKMLGGQTYNCAGFVGWNETNDNANGKVIIIQSLFAPINTEMIIQKTFVRSRDFSSNVVTLNTCYSTAYYDDDQCNLVHSVTTEGDVSLTHNHSGSTSFGVSGIVFYDTPGLTFDGVLYAKQNDQLNLTLTDTGTPPEGKTLNGFATTAGTLTKNDDGSYKLKMSKANATIYATYMWSGEDWTSTGSGTAGDPYIITTADQWNIFVRNINANYVDFATAYYELGADISVTTMVGTNEHPFKGHFNGKGHTLTVNYGTPKARINEDYCAPFRYVEGTTNQGAEISNLNVGGTIYTAKQFAAGIVGHAGGNNTITGCLSSVTIDSNVRGDGTHGGLVANVEGGSTSIKDCAFTGSLLGENTNRLGGLVGWTAGDYGASVSFNNCLFAPADLTVNTSGSATFSRGNGITLTGCYYISTLGASQGTLCYTTAPSGIVCVSMTIAGVSFYAPKTFVRNIAANAITPYSATISWMADGDYRPYQVRYQKKSVYFVDFEEDSMPEGWTTVDADGDGNGWFLYNSSYDDETHSGNQGVASASYRSGSPLTPDNWLISPLLDLGGTLSVWLSGNDNNDYEEHFAIYLSTTGTDVADFTTVLVPETVTKNYFQQYTADLSSYAGQTGYIAIRHFNCEDQYYLLLDDFEVSIHEGWTTVTNADAAGTTISGLQPLTTYEYQVGYTDGGNTYFSPSGTLTTINDEVAPTNLAVTNITANTATVNWTAYTGSYNLRYRSYTGNSSKVTLYIPQPLWDDESGYQMLLDANHDTYGRIFKESGPLTDSGDAPIVVYDEFEYKIPGNADGSLNTKYKVDGSENNKSVTIEIPAGTYDWCITNPTPDDRLWIASENGNVGGRQDDFVFEPGKHYTFTVTIGGSNDCVDMTVNAIGSESASEWTTVSDISNTSSTLSDLTANTFYLVQVMAKKDEWTSDWIFTSFTTTETPGIVLANNADNSAVVTANDGQMVNVTLAGRTLYKDGSWNTLCLPFDVTDSNIGNDTAFEGTLLEGATAMGYDHSTFNSATGTLELTFAPIWSVKAGTPFLVKWSNGEPLVNPQFENVTIKATTETTVSDTNADFIGSFSPVALEANDRSVLYLGGDDKLYYPTAARNIGSCRAYFQLKGITAGDLASNARTFVLNFDDGETTEISNTKHSDGADTWYDMQGRRLSRKPSRAGVYLNNSKKIAIK